MYVLKSRKFWAAIVGLVLIFYTAWERQEVVDAESVINAVMGVVAAYIGSVALEDGLTNRDGKPMDVHVEVDDKL